MTRILSAILLMVVVAGLVLAGCSPSAPASEPSTPTPAPTTSEPAAEPEVITLTWGEQNFEQAWTGKFRDTIHETNRRSLWRQSEDRALLGADPG